MRRRQFPKELHIGTEIYTVRFVDRCEDEGNRGETCPSTRVISILANLTPTEMTETLIHEILHAFELEYELKVPHKTVYALETPIYNFIRDNVFRKCKCR